MQPNGGMSEDEAMRRAMEESLRTAPAYAQASAPPLPPKPTPFRSGGPIPVAQAVPAGPSAVIVVPARPPPQRRACSSLAALLIAIGCAVAIVVGVVVGLNVYGAGSSIFTPNAGATRPPLVSDSSSTPTVPTPQPTRAQNGCAMPGGTQLSSDVYACPATWSGAKNMRAPSNSTCGGSVPCDAPNDACAGGFEICGYSGDFSALYGSVSQSQCNSLSSTSYFLTAGAHVDIVDTNDCLYDTQISHVTFLMGCPSSGRGSQVPCCGAGCVAPPSGCADMLFTGGTKVAPSGACAAQPAPPAGGGVLCCVSTPAPTPGMVLQDNGGYILPSPRIFNYFWGSQWASSTFAGDKITGLQQLVQGISGTPYASMLTQYFNGKPITLTYVNTHIDTTATPTFPYPSSAPSPSADNAAFTAVSNAAALTLCNYIASNLASFPTNVLQNTIFNVYLDRSRPSWSLFCAFHDATQCTLTNKQKLTFFYAVYWTTDSDAGCTLSLAHTRSQGLTNLASATAHEVYEAATDTLGDAYFTSANNGGQEISDLCATVVYGVQLNDKSTWSLQGQWDNRILRCSAGA